jgi:beta-glucanase (GH16 family)
MTERVINIAFRIVFHSIHLIFFEQKISNNAIFIYLLFSTVINSHFSPL